LRLALRQTSGGSDRKTGLRGYASRQFVAGTQGMGRRSSNRLACLSIFWSVPTALLAGTAAAGGIALVNSMGNLSGFVAPYTISQFNK